MSTPSRDARSILLAILLWHIACLVMMFVYRDLLAQFVLAAYVSWAGDVQKSYGTFERVSYVVGLVVTLIPANVLALWIFAPSTHPAMAWKQLTTIFCGWLVAAFAVVTLDRELGLHSRIHDLTWMVFGVPDNLYTFYNLMLHRVISWLITTTPIAWIALSLRSTVRE